MAQTITVYRSSEGVPFSLDVDLLVPAERGDTQKHRITGTATGSEKTDIHYDFSIVPGYVTAVLTAISRSNSDFVAGTQLSLHIDDEIHDLTTDSFGEAVLTVPGGFATLALHHGNEVRLSLKLIDLGSDLMTQVYVENADSIWRLSIPDAAIVIPFDGTPQGLVSAIANLPEEVVETERGKTLKFRDLMKRLRKLGIEVLLVRGTHPYKAKSSSGLLVPIPFHGDNYEFRPGTIRSIARQLGMSFDELFEA